MREVDQFIYDRRELQAIHFFFINCAVNFRMLGRFKFHTILPKIHPVTHDYTLTGPNDHPFIKRGKKVGLEATGKINRFDFGMDWNKMPGAVGKEVEISVNLEADKP